MHSISCLEIIYGSFQTHKKRLPLANPPAGGVGSAEILDTEEKGSDVNLAVHLVNDAWHGRFDCAVVVSNDSDLAEAM